MTTTTTNNSFGNQNYPVSSSVQRTPITYTKNPLTSQTSLTAKYTPKESPTGTLNVQSQNYSSIFRNNKQPVETRVVRYPEEIRRAPENYDISKNLNVVSNKIRRHNPLSMFIYFRVNE